MELLKELETHRIIEMRVGLMKAITDAGGGGDYSTFSEMPVSALFEVCAHNGISVVFTRNRKSIDEES